MSSNVLLIIQTKQDDLEDLFEIHDDRFENYNLSCKFKIYFRYTQGKGK